MTSKADLNNNTPSIAQLQQVSSGELITAEVENANNLLNLNAIILAYNWIIDNGADLSLANIYTVAQEFSAGIKTNSIESLTTNANIVINNGTGVIYKNSVATNNKITTVADVVALITTGSDLTDGNKGGVIVSGAGTVWTLVDVVAATAPSVTGPFDCNNHNIREVKSATFHDEIDNGNSSTADTIDWGAGNCHKSTMTGNCTYTFTAPVGPAHLTLKLIQDTPGSRTATWPAAVKWSAATAPALTTGANKTDIVTFYYDGTNYFGAWLGDFG
jgi:hypothetical protein